MYMCNIICIYLYVYIYVRYIYIYICEISDRHHCICVEAPTVRL